MQLYIGWVDGIYCSAVMIVVVVVVVLLYMLMMMQWLIKQSESLGVFTGDVYAGWGWGSDLTRLIRVMETNSITAESLLGNQFGKKGRDI